MNYLVSTLLGLMHLGELPKIPFLTSNNQRKACDPNPAF